MPSTLRFSTPRNHSATDVVSVYSGVVGTLAYVSPFASCNFSTGIVEGSCSFIVPNTTSTQSYIARYLRQGNRMDVAALLSFNSSLCAGCDGIPNSGSRLDDCGVCGGPGGCSGIMLLTLHSNPAVPFSITPVVSTLCIGQPVTVRWTAPRNRTEAFSIVAYDDRNVYRYDVDISAPGVDGVTSLPPLPNSGHFQLEQFSSHAAAFSYVPPNSTASIFVNASTMDGCGVCGGGNSSCGGCSCLPFFLT